MFSVVLLGEGGGELIEIGGLIKNLNLKRGRGLFRDRVLK